MPFNLLKNYPDLLEVGHLSEPDRSQSLRGVFERDIENNQHFRFQGKNIYPIKGEEPAMQLLFRHLITEGVETVDKHGRTYTQRIFEIHRSQRLHWVKYHIDEKTNKKIEIFSTEERINGKKKYRTYIYNLTQKYVVVLEPQRSKTDYYLLSAYYLNKHYGEKKMKKKMKSKLKDIL